MVNKPWKWDHDPNQRPLGCNGRYGGSGARVHRERGEDVCQKCSDSSAHYQRERRRGAFKPRPLAPCGTPSAGHRHRQRGEPIDFACQVALSKQQVELRARKRAMSGKLPSKGPYSPWSVGPRTLVAMTCRTCGRLADGASFPILNRGKRNQSRRQHCHDCHNGRKKRDREEKGIGVPAPRPPEKLQSRRKTRWTKEDDDLLRKGLDDGQSYEDIALKLGRSLRAVYKRRDILGLAAVRMKHRVERPWTIQTGGNFE